MSDEASKLMAPIEAERLAPFEPPADMVFPGVIPNGAS